MSSASHTTAPSLISRIKSSQPSGTTMSSSHSVAAQPRGSVSGKVFLIQRDSRARAVSGRIPLNTPPDSRNSRHSARVRTARSVSRCRAWSLSTSSGFEDATSLIDFPLSKASSYCHYTYNVVTVTNNINENANKRKIITRRSTTNHKGYLRDHLADEPPMCFDEGVRLGPRGLSLSEGCLYDPGHQG